MLNCLPPKLAIDTRGGHRTKWHYLTEHRLEDIQNAGNNYWVRVSDVLRKGDIIEVSDHEYAWWYEILIAEVNKGAPLDQVVVTELRGEIHYRDPELMADRVRKQEEQRLAAEEKQRRELQAREEADRAQAEREKQNREKKAAELAQMNQRNDSKADNPSLQPVVVWKGPQVRWCIMAFDTRVADCFQEKEQAQAALDAGDHAESIEAARAAWIENNKDI